MGIISSLIEKIPTTSKLEYIVSFANGVVGNVPKPENLAVYEGAENITLECSGVEVYGEDPVGYYFSCVKAGEDLNNNLVRKIIAELANKEKPSHIFSGLEANVEYVLAIWAYKEGSEVWGPPAKKYGTPRAVEDPVAVNDTFAFLEDSIDNKLDVLANDSDVDGDPLKIKSVTEAEHGAVVNKEDFIEYTPSPYYCGLDRFKYTVTDGEETHEAEVTINIACRSSEDKDFYFCYTATRAFGEDSPQVKSLRAFKNDVLLNKESLLYPLTSKAVDEYNFLGSRLVEYADKHPSPGRIIDTLLRPPIALAAKLIDIQKK